jgi:hypothetical protein
MSKQPSINDPTPDEFCPHVEAGTEMTGGWYFAARVPPVAVGMCHDCIVWCQQHFETQEQRAWDQYVKQQWAEDDRVLEAKEVG